MIERMSFIVNENTGNPLKTSQILRGFCNGKKRINNKIPEKKIFCMHIIDEIYVGIVKLHFSQICNRVTALD